MSNAEENAFYREMFGCSFDDAEAVKNMDWFPGFRAFLMCGLEAIYVKSGVEVYIALPDGNCCDMNGAIKLAKFMLPTVTSIKVFSGKKFDCEYRFKNGSWSCLDYPSAPEDQVAARAKPVAKKADQQTSSAEPDEEFGDLLPFLKRAGYEDGLNSKIRDDELLTIAAAARRLGVSRPRLSTYLKNAKVKKVASNGKELIRFDDAVACLNALKAQGKFREKKTVPASKIDGAALLGEILSSALVNMRADVQQLKENYVTVSSQIAELSNRLPKRF